jgi:hypothetical protein
MSCILLCDLLIDVLNVRTFTKWIISNLWATWGCTLTCSRIMSVKLTELIVVRNFWSVWQWYYAVRSKKRGPSLSLWSCLDKLTDISSWSWYATFEVSDSDTTHYEARSGVPHCPSDPVWTNSPHSAPPLSSAVCCSHTSYSPDNCTLLDKCLLVYWQKSNV